MKTSLAGRNAIAGREDVRLRAYKDTKGIPTIGVGHTTAAGVPAVKMGMTITRAECDEIFERDLAAFEKTVNDVVGNTMTTDSAGNVRASLLSQNQFDALVSLCFNIGQPAFRKSTVARLLNAGDLANVPRAMLMWKKPPELIGRRRGEVRQFLTPDNLT